MRKFLIPAAAALVALSAGGAFAASATGAIKAIDAAHHTVTLDNGQVYQFAATANLSGWHVGDKTQITYQVQNGKNMASAAVKA